MFVFVRKKLAFVEPAKRRFINSFCVQKINQNKNKSKKIFVVFTFLLFLTEKLSIATARLLPIVLGLTVLHSNQDEVTPF